MALELNKFIGIGNLGKDAVAGPTTNGGFRAAFSIAMNRSRKNKDTGEYVNETTWIDCVYFGKGAEGVAPFLTKGKGVLVEGRLQVREYTDKDGNQRKTVEVNVSDVKLMPDKATGTTPAPSTELDGFDFAESSAEEVVPF